MQIKLFKNKKNFKKGGIGARPYFFWNVLFVVVFFIILGFLVFSFIFFKQINQDQILSLDGVSTKSQTISKERIEKVLKYFYDRENKSVNILNSPSPVVDPSL